MEATVEQPRLVPAGRSTVSSRTGIEQLIKAYFGGNAFVAVVVLALITFFLIREGSGFFGQNLANLRLYRSAGLEYVDIIRATADDHAGPLARPE
jgi:phosphate transport system permease protein